MAEVNKVVVRYLDGRTVKGTTADFVADRPAFHVTPVGGSTSVAVKISDLKSVYFVKDLGGDPARRDVPGFVNDADVTGGGRKIAVAFKDGEVLCGRALSYRPNRLGFFVNPDDPNGNNLRVYVLEHATSRVGIGPEAVAIAQEGKRDAA